MCGYPPVQLEAFVDIHTLSPVLVKDFSRSFSDGRLFVCLVNHLRPGMFSVSICFFLTCTTGSIPNSFLSSAAPRDTLQKAFESAEQFVGIAPLLDAEDVVSGRIDEHCVMYVKLNGQTCGLKLLQDLCFIVSRSRV